MSRDKQEARAADAIAAVLARFDLPADSVRSLAALVGLLVTDDRAPTAIRDPRRAIDEHLADSLVALELSCVRGALRVADLGAGAGFPGLPLALALPSATVSLVESSARRCSFIRHATEVSAARNASVVNTRIELWAEGAGQHDLVTARALAPLPVVVEYAAPLLRIGGWLVAWRGRRDSAAETAAAAAAAEVGLEPLDPRRVIPYQGAEHRYLHAMVKVSPTPDRFPRRPGIAVKRPLGSASSQPGRYGDVAALGDEPPNVRPGAPSDRDQR